MDNNDRYQVVRFVSAIAGYLGLGALLAQVPWLPHWLVWSPAAVLGYACGEIQAATFCGFPGIRNRAR